MLSAHALTRDFSERRAVDGVDLIVRPGRITGFVGANGAGKTTTMRMLMGVLGATSGEVHWQGRPATVEDRRSFGYMPEERGLYPRMTLVDQLAFFARLHGASARSARARALELLGFFDLGDRADDLLDSLSLGNQQRVQIAAALVHRPTALVLDEPFSGLDPHAVDAMLELLQREAGDVPVLFSSHQLDLVERICDDLVVLAGGRVVSAGTVDELRSQGAESYRVEVAGHDAGWVKGLDGVLVQEIDGPVATLSLAGLPADDLVASLASRGAVLEVARVRPSLSEIFREATR
ncbi:putative ABC transporter ATP-binding protein YxlF [Nocardioides dokdonensis FR1436]|uniref:Putative ABC transporter ATP-binding protein YxlF n=1 Tax=Nocardioides dokdonensis FR1436 TaxID=1300347 RepID=A0A1A9GIM1_9ACTN|nr:ATP-binding cassette domain-containing protein [Nocardioides dokdonensis]ANH37926.1 putative ABC transporter ATP-binding protein YxlF [Nocardioides dokdonensis FR1436]